MRKSVFVHVGAPAAQATFFRQQLAVNEAALGGAGIAVVVPHGRDSPPDRLADAVLAADHPTIVVSDDGLAAADDVGGLLARLAGHRVQVIYGAPDLGTAIVAEWQRHVLSTGQPVSLATWVETLVAGEHPSFWRTYGLSDVFTRWSVPSGDVHVIVVPANRGSVGELWARFRAIIGAPPGATKVVAHGEDVIDLEVLELLRRVHARSEDVAAADVDQPVLDAVAGRAATGSGGTRPLLPARHRAWVNRQSSLQRKFLEGSGFEVVGDPAELEVDDERFGEGGAIVDDEAVLGAGIETGAVLVERLITARERRGPIETSPDRSERPAPVRKPDVVVRARRKASRAYGSAQGAVRRAGRRVVHRNRRTYYLHIGAPKCGSSYLQSLLWRNREALRRRGVYVPGRSQADHFTAGTDFRGRPYVTQTADGPWRGAWERLLDDAERSGYGKIVISSEFLASADPDVIAPRLERLADDNVQVVYAVREFAGLLGSVWQQGVRTGRVAPWPEWLDGLAGKHGADWMWTHHNVGRILDGWGRAGVDQIHVLVVPPPGAAPGELWRRFGSIVGWRARTRIAAPRGNESLGYAQAEVLRRLQELLVEVEPRTHRARVTKNLIGEATLAPMDRVDRLVIPERLRPWVEAESERQRDAIVNSSAHVVGDVRELLIDDSRFSPEPAGPNPAAMLDAAVAVVARLARTVLREEAGVAAAAGSGEAPEPGHETAAAR